MFDILLGTSSLLRLQSPKFRPRKFRTARNNFVPHHRHVTLIVCSLTWIGCRVHLWKRRLINRKRSKKLSVLEVFRKFSKRSILRSIFDQINRLKLTQFVETDIKPIFDYYQHGRLGKLILAKLDEFW